MLKFDCKSRKLKVFNLLFFFLVSIGTSAQTTWDGSSWSNGIPDSTIDATIAGIYDTSLDDEISANSAFGPPMPALLTSTSSRP